MLTEVTRHVKDSDRNMLWGKAAGRCEFDGCNRPLWKSSITQETVNLAQAAHIYSFAVYGPRGRGGIASSQINDIGNLLLVCHPCHRKIDNKLDGGIYTPELLRKWKQEHERRIEIVTGIVPAKQSHILLYGANVGYHSGRLSYSETAPALFPHRYPASDRGIELGMINSSFSEKDPEFWVVETKNLSRRFVQDVKQSVSTGEIKHLSVFALAPQPLLIQLGTLLGDIVPCDVFQLHREPAGWSWPSDQAEAQDFVITRPEEHREIPALIVALSGTVVDERVTAVLGESVSVWRISVTKPNNDLIKTKEQLAAFRTCCRQVFDEIKTIYGQKTALNVFPVAGVSTCVEFGRVRMPKADMPWAIYDENPVHRGFAHAITIAFAENQ